MAGEIDSAGDFSYPWKAAGGAAGKGEVGIGGQKKGGWGKFPEQKSLLGSLRASQGDE